MQFVLPEPRRCARQNANYRKPVRCLGGYICRMGGGDADKTLIGGLLIIGVVALLVLLALALLVILGLRG